MPDYGMNFNVNAPGADNTIQLMGRLHKQLQESTQQQISFAKGMVEMSRSFEEAQKSALGFTKILQNTFAFGTVAKAAGEFNKQLFDLSRQSKVTGVSFVDMKRGIDSVNAATHLSKVETASLFKAMQDNVKGIKLTSNEMSKLAMTLTTEYGASLDDVKEGLTSLLSLQQKEIHVLNRVNQGFKAGELGAYATALMTVNGASEKEIETLFRVAKTHGDRSKALSKEEIELRKYKDAMQSLEKTGQDLLVKFGQPLINMFSSMADGVKSFAGTIEPIINAPWFQKMLKIGVVGGVAAAGLATIARPVLGVARVAKDVLAATAGQKGTGGRAGGVVSALMGGSSLGGQPVDVRVVEIVPGAGNSLGDAISKATGKGGTAAQAAGGGMGSMLKQGWKGYGGRVIKGGIAGIGLGLAGEGAGQVADAAGYSGVGTGLRTAGKVAGYAATGASLGSIIPGVGNIIGGAAGALYGLYDSFDDLEKAFGMSEKAAKDAAKAANDQAKALGAVASSKQMKDAFGHDDKDLWKKEQYEGVVKQSMGGRDYDSLSQAEQKAAFAKTSEITKTESVSGASRTDASGFFAGAMRQQLAEQAASGITDPEKKDEVIRKTLMGLPTSIQAAFTKSLKDSSKVAGARSAVQAKFGGTFAGENAPDDKDVVKKFDLDNEQQFVRGLMQIRNEYAQIKTYTDAIVQANNAVADVLATINGDVAAARQMDQQSIMAKQQELQLLQIAAKLQADLLNGDGSRVENQKKLAEAIASSTMSEEEKFKMAQKYGSMEASHADLLKSQAVIQKEITQLQVQSGQRNSSLVDLARDKVEILEQEAEIAKAMFMGGGASVELQLRQVSAIREQKKLVDDTVMSLQKEQAIYKRDNGGKANLAIQHSINAAVKERGNLALKELSVTKNLREGYLQSMQAFTNVEGTFSKIIMSQEMGVDTIMEKFGAPGGQQLGKRGAGGSEPIIRWGPGGQVKYQSEQETFDRAMKYDPDMLNPMAFGGDLAAATKGQPAEDFLRGQGLDKTLGKGDGPGSDIQKVITEPVVMGLGNLGENMPQHVADGIRLAGGLKPIADSVKQGDEKSRKEAKQNTTALIKNDKVENQKMMSKKDADNKQGVGEDADEAIKKAFADKQEKVKQEGNEWAQKLKAFGDQISQQRHNNNTNTVGQKTAGVQEPAPEAVAASKRRANMTPDQIMAENRARLDEEHKQKNPRLYEIAAQRKAKGLALGGSVPGVGSTDTVPAMLTPGEYVLPKGVVQKHMGIIKALHQNKFAEGGVVGPDQGASEWEALRKTALEAKRAAQIRAARGTANALPDLEYGQIPPEEAAAELKAKFKAEAAARQAAAPKQIPPAQAAAELKARFAAEAA